MNSTKKNKNGCLWIFIFGLISLFGWIFISVFTNINPYISALIAMFLAAILTSKWFGRPSFKGIIINITIILLLIFGLRFISKFFLEAITIASEETAFKIEESVSLTTIIENNDTISVYSSHHVWRDNYGNNFEGKLSVRDKDYLRLKDKLKSWTARDATVNFWGNLYDYLEQTNGPSLDLVIDTFQEIHSERKLNQMEFAEMVVTCIQDIPYSFVFQEACLAAENYDPSIRRILEECPECCLGNVIYGIQNPVSFLQNLKGDCDTRTVIIYSILKHFNYDVAIMNSEFYQHSIIGINLPAKGLYKRHYGKKYVVWETTAKYYEAGNLPGNFDDITHWNVILTSK
jgi:hypothetical protein